MTTKPKARKFRVRRTDTPGDGAAVAPQPAQAADAPKDGQAAQAKPDQEIAEGDLTPRQMRMARRIALRQGITVESDIDAVRKLRERGIDPFQKDSRLELVAPAGAGGPQAKGAPGENGKVEADGQLPQTVPGGGFNLPSTEQLSPAERRAREIKDMQQQLLRRRQRKVAMLFARLAFFVFLPTAIAGYYFYSIATPMYSTESEFLIIQSEGSGGGVGGLLSGTQFATNSDSIATQGYLKSKDAMLRLDRDAGFKEHWTQSWIDPIQRLTSSPTNEEAYKTYKKNIKIGYDPTEGVIRMEVIAANPEVAKQFSERLIAYAEERVNNLSDKKRQDQMRDARESFDNAVDERRAAQEELVRLQLEGSTLDPEGVIAGLRAQINNVELQLLEKELQLAALLDNARPNQARVDGAQSDVRRLQNQLDQLNTRMTDASQGENSLAQLTVRIQMAQADLATRDALLQSALQQMEQTRTEANRQVRYLTTAVEPVASEEPSYPRAFENTILAFLIFTGIYLMISLTASILREQVTA